MKSVNNPPDIAVALNYDGTNAPRVTAKGRGQTAEQIIALAKEHNRHSAPHPCYPELAYK